MVMTSSLGLLKPEHLRILKHGLDRKHLVWRKRFSLLNVMNMMMQQAVLDRKNEVLITDRS